MKGRCLPLVTILSAILLAYSTFCEANSHNLVKRQSFSRPGGGSIPLSRSRQFPPPEEEDSEEYVNPEDDEETKSAPSPGFRGRKPQRPQPEEEYVDDYTYTEAPKITTPAPQRPTSRTVVFNNRFAARPKFGSQSTSTTSKPSTAASSSRFRATPAQSQRLDVVANIPNKPPPARPSSQRSIATSRTGNESNRPAPLAEITPKRTTNTTRVRTRGRLRQRTSSTTTTTTTTKAPLSEEYYYYYDDEEEAQKSQPIATTTSTTTTTTTPRPRTSFRSRPVSTRIRSTSRPVKFDPESQFAPPPDDIVDIPLESSSTKRFTTSSTMSPAESGGIPSHLRSMYRPRTDGRFIDFLRDPNRPRELKGFDLTDYPFYITVPEDIDFECDDKKDGYYASIPHRCQLFHYCFASQRFDFLCANYTLYDQTTFTCRFANNVNCENSAKFYFRNDDLWKDTTTAAPSTTSKRPRRPRPPARVEDYDDDYYEDDYEDEEEDRRRRPPKRRRNRNRKNRRKQQADDDDDE